MSKDVTNVAAGIVYHRNQALRMILTDDKGKAELLTCVWAEQSSYTNTALISRSN